ncbi:hypothetical protein Sru01_36810 [Sphaerisporangium rufum]|uniref:N-acetyltransferase domain-containing protein n=1 Tax=Sphaerisporangium rufum TaxID=1381558 RepID=A0A919R2V4_9ACTN|nr:hypothetical protein [Sphaerisporangium rufum]GII78699.1 hypothetical protein Sru01_36810 [Sphaerisporangium rufum]
MAWQEVMAAPEVRACPSPHDTARFGRPVERLTVPDGSAPEAFAQVRAAVLDSAADVIILRYPADLAGWAAGLAALGRTVLLADSLVYWRLPAGRGRAPDPLPGLRVAEPRDPATAERLAAEIFAGYAGHYLANPLFDPAGAEAGYAEWAGRSAAAGDCLTAVDRSGTFGLATVAEDGPRTEILLAGVVPGRQAQGLYAHVLRAVEERALAGGGTEVVISTQGHHTRVQRAWARYGFEPVSTFYTLHLVRPGLLPAT